MTTTSEVHEIAEQVAKATVREFFLTLGTNADDPESVFKLQKDLGHLRAWREASETIKRKGLGAAVTIIVTGMIGFIWLAIQHK